MLALALPEGKKGRLTVQGSKRLLNKAQKELDAATAQDQRPEMAGAAEGRERWRTVGADVAAVAGSGPRVRH